MGGSSSINAMVYVRGNHKDFDQWANMGNPGWSYNEFYLILRKWNLGRMVLIILEVVMDH